MGSRRGDAARRFGDGTDLEILLDGKRRDKGECRSPAPPIAVWLSRQSGVGLGGCTMIGRRSACAPASTADMLVSDFRRRTMLMRRLRGDSGSTGSNGS